MTAKYPLRSSLTFRPDKRDAVKYHAPFGELCITVGAVATELKQECHLTMQHDLRKDRIALLCDVGTKSYSAVGTSFETACTKLDQKLRELLP